MSEAGSAEAEPGFATRVGMALVAPLAAFATVRRGGKMGLGDVTTLLFLKVLAVEARAVVAALWSMITIGPMSGLSLLGSRLPRALGTDVVLLIAGGLLVTVLGGKARQVGRDFDLAALAWVPYLGFSLVVSLVVMVLGVKPSRLMTDVAGGVGLLLWATWLGLAVRFVRRGVK